MKHFCMKIYLISQGRGLYCFCPPAWRQWRHMKMLNNYNNIHGGFGSSAMCLSIIISKENNNNNNDNNNNNNNKFVPEKYCKMFHLVGTLPCNRIFRLLWLVSNKKKPMIICARSTSRSREQNTKRRSRSEADHAARTRERFVYSIVKNNEIVWLSATW